MNKKIVAFGEIMLRLTPQDKKMISSAGCFEAYYGGTESNVLVCLSAFGNQTEYLTAIPDNDLGNAVLRHLRSYNVGTENIVKRGDNLGMYFLEEGFADRNSKVIYHRKYAEVTKMTGADCDYDKLFADCGIFHISGISFALSNNARQLSFDLIKEARKRNILVSFDFNYRGKLWTVEEAGEVYRDIIDDVDILFCSERDLKAFLNTDYEHYYEKYSTQYVVMREREVRADGRHVAGASITHLVEGKSLVAKKGKVEFGVLERIGGGDAFAGGVLHCLNRNMEDIETAVDFGMACFVLKHTVKGDVFALEESAVEAYRNDVLKDVSR